jgi:hypothetical protein
MRVMLSSTNPTITEAILTSFPLWKVKLTLTLRELSSSPLVETPLPHLTKTRRKRKTFQIGNPRNLTMRSVFNR